MSNYLLLLVGAYLALNSTSTPRDADNSIWNAYKSIYGKEYASETEEYLRKSVFSHNLGQLIEAKKQLEEDEAGFELVLNHLADVSQLEIKARNGFRAPRGLNQLRNSPEAQKFLDDLLSSNSSIPDSVDWRQVPGRVSPVKNQGQCGSCWSFASVGALEGQESVRKHLRQAHDDEGLTELSEQNLVDCVKAAEGCNGGFMKDAFEFVKVEGGIDDEISYPYEARTRKCRFKKNRVAFTDSGAAILPSGDEEKLKEVVAKFGPVAVAIDASSFWFQLYHKGVYYNKHCKNKEEELDHAVLVVGYGTDPKKGDYWIVKNSWGSRYGQHGYILMARNRNNNCGIATVATIPTF